MTAAPAVAAALALVAAVGCASTDAAGAQDGGRGRYLGTDSMGVVPASPTMIRVQARRELVENSAAALSATQPGVVFTVNDANNDALLFALDTTGADRGMWRVAGTRNIDWEATSTGPCAPREAADATPVPPCVYIGDVGDNDEKRPTRVIYKIAEPVAQGAGFTGVVTATPLVYRYADGPRDVEAMYVAPDGDIYLITKRRLGTRRSGMRPALVYHLPASAWQLRPPAVATLVDSLPIVPGSAPLRQITDAALSPDARYLAVRTYAQLYIFATDPATGRVLAGRTPSVCNIIALDRWQGEGVTWFGRSRRLLLTSEGSGAPMYTVDCPLPGRGA